MWFFCHILKVAAWLGIGAIALASLVPGELRPHAIPSARIEHVLAYLVVTLSMRAAYRDAIGSLLLGTAMTGYAGILEACQIWAPSRNPAIYDWLASSSGVWIALALWQCLLTWSSWLTGNKTST